MEGHWKQKTNPNLILVGVQAIAYLLNSKYKTTHPLI